MINKIYGLLAVALSLFATGSYAYDMPIGIPAPNFGAVLGNPVTAALPANPAGWPSQEVAGYYYIDNTSSNSTDSGNTYGYPNKPRKSLPSSLSAGSVVEVRGGPYIYQPADFNITINGTITAPVYIYGVNKPVVSGTRSNINGSYFIFDGFVLSESRIITSGASFATIRNTEVHGPNLQNGASLGGNNIVFYNNNVHHHQGSDKHGVTITQGSSNVWVLNNLLHHNGGDGIQFCHGCSASPPRNVYVGRNIAYGNRENGIDLKYGENIVVSENETYHHYPVSAGVEFCYDDNSGCTTDNSGSDGASIVVGSDGAPRNVWVIANRVHDSGKGIRIEEAYDGVVLGNVIYDVDSIGIEFEKAGEGPNTVDFNTISNTTTGIKGPWQGGALEITINNNIIANISGTSLDVGGTANICRANNNLFYNNGSSIFIRWETSESSVYTSGSAIDSKVNGSGNLLGNPQFTNSSAKDFSVLASGAGVNKANNDLIALNDRFASIFGNGASILKDAEGNLRSNSGANHDIGAYENDGSAGNAPPSPPIIY